MRKILILSTILLLSACSINIETENKPKEEKMYETLQAYKNEKTNKPEEINALQITTCTSDKLDCFNTHVMFEKYKERKLIISNTEKYSTENISKSEYENIYVDTKDIEELKQLEVIVQKGYQYDDSVKRKSNKEYTMVIKRNEEVFVNFDDRSILLEWY
jgi:hypothetical protein